MKWELWKNPKYSRLGSNNNNNRFHQDEGRLFLNRLISYSIVSFQSQITKSNQIVWFEFDDKFRKNFFYNHTLVIRRDRCPKEIQKNYNPKKNRKKKKVNKMD